MTIQFDVILSLAILTQKQVVLYDENDIFAKRDIFEIECMIKEKRLDVSKMFELIQSAKSSLSANNIVAPHLLTAMGVLLLHNILIIF